MSSIRILLLASLAAGAAVVIACVGDNNTTTTGNANCTNYCNTIMAKCVANDSDDGGPTVNNQVYKDNQTCLDMCAFIPLTGPDSINSRLAELDNLQDVGAHNAADRHGICLLSGAFACSGGANTACCEDFCTLDEKICATLPPYQNHADCLAKCQTYPSAFTGPFVGSTGDNLQCRHYHLENAVVSDQAKIAHCPHTGVASALCMDPVMDAGADAGVMDASGD